MSGDSLLWMMGDVDLLRIVQYNKYSPFNGKISKFRLWHKAGPGAVVL
jgi:hypothetical protein